MSFDLLRSPLAFFESVLGPYAPLDPGIVDYAAWWAAEGYTLADGSDDARLLARGYAAGIIRRVHVQESLLPSFAQLYITGFYAPWIAGLFGGCLVTRHIVDKYALDGVRDSFLARLQATENPALGSFHLSTSDTRFTARATTDGWRLAGDDAPLDGVVDVTLFTAYPEGAQAEVLFLVPKSGDDGSANRGKSGQLRDSLAYLMATPDDGPALRMEIETLNRAFGTIIWLGAAQGDFARHEISLEHVDGLRTALALAWAAAQTGDDTAREVAGLYSDAYQRFRLLAVLAEFQCLEIANSGKSVPGGPTQARVEHALAKLPAQVFDQGPPLLAELAEFTDAAAPLGRKEEAKAWAQVLAQAYARKFEAAVKP